MVPHDLKELFACLLSPADYRLWKQRWKKSLETILPELLRSEESAVDADENPLSIDHLCGEGNWGKPEEQARVLPQPVLAKITEAAEKEQIERQVDKPELQEQLVLEMAKANCNDICKQVIFSLPMYPPPTLDVLIDACEKKVPLVGASRVPPPPQAARRTPTAAVTQHPSGQFILPPARTTQCYRCGQLGHMARDCPTAHLRQGLVGNGSGERVLEGTANKK
ncbi:uncharacterized protein LOC111942207 [Cyanistes caeruleus]|uniref:uncharacterized protein LOC111942207 n=1 Tax=Cyanistes caeruleus TaxID=156563 RepID=UPI000CDA8B44|nr:uncharacterized protein LOC111942207 [Cyanistes caeruleus]